MDEKCTKIYNQYVCHNDEVFQKFSKGCLKSILNGIAATCEAKETGTDEIIIEAEDGNVVLINAVNISVIPSCKQQFMFSGCALINTKNCTTQINNLTYGENIGEFTEDLEIFIPTRAPIFINKTTQELSLQTLHLMGTRNFGNILKVGNSTSSHLIYTYVWLGITTIGVILIMVLNLTSKLSF